MKMFLVVDKYKLGIGTVLLQTLRKNRQKPNFSHFNKYFLKK